MNDTEGGMYEINIPTGFNPNDLEAYISRHSTHEDEVLYHLNRQTNLTTYHPRMISGQIQGKLLEFVSRMVSPSRILEIGTFTGYSAICLARGLAPHGHLHTIEINDEVAETAKYYVERSGLDNCITIHIGDAVDVIPTLKDKFELVLIDGDKRQYPQYLKCVLDCICENSIILADNVLWGGKVLMDEHNDPFTRALKEFNSTVQSNPRFENVLLPLRDGLMMIRALY